jgi:hypothetical protein
VPRGPDLRVIAVRGDVEHGTRSRGRLGATVGEIVATAAPDGSLERWQASSETNRTGRAEASSQ